MELCKPTIIVIAYNRETALERILGSLKNADYPENVRLVISIDKSDNEKVAMVADEFEWQFGEKLVLKREENMGLKAHVLACGDMTKEYGSIIMLEDDLYVSKGFYKYSQAALDFSKQDERIAGISLYNHLLNVHVREPFKALDDGYDNWYFQFASSWGQAFSYEQWTGFKKFLSENDGKDLAAVNFPANVSGWSDKSWLKYYIKYMVDNDLYFVYPRVSLTTNFSDEGTHADSASDDLQVELLMDSKDDWKFSKLEESIAIYDAFFENVVLREKVCEIANEVLKENVCEIANEVLKENVCEVDKNLVVVDLYGYKSRSTDLKGCRYLLTSNPKPFEIVKSFGRHLRPVDANIFEELLGNDFFLYDLEKSGELPKTDHCRKLLYNYRAFKAKYGVEIILRRLHI